jgi:hypothetical protein
VGVAGVEEVDKAVAEGMAGQVEQEGLLVCEEEPEVSLMEVEVAVQEARDMWAVEGLEGEGVSGYIAREVVGEGEGVAMQEAEEAEVMQEAEVGPEWSLQRAMEGHRQSVAQVVMALKSH